MMNGLVHHTASQKNEIQYTSLPPLPPNTPGPRHRCCHLMHPTHSLACRRDFLWRRQVRRDEGLLVQPRGVPVGGGARQGHRRALRASFPRRQSVLQQARPHHRATGQGQGDGGAAQHAAPGDLQEYWEGGMERPRGNGHRGPRGYQDAELQLPRHGVLDSGAVLAGLQEERCWPVIFLLLFLTCTQRSFDQNFVCASAGGGMKLRPRCPSVRRHRLCLRSRRHSVSCFVLRLRPMLRVEGISRWCGRPPCAFCVTGRGRILISPSTSFGRLPSLHRHRMNYCCSMFCLLGAIVVRASPRLTLSESPQAPPMVASGQRVADAEKGPPVRVLKLARPIEAFVVVVEFFVASDRYTRVYFYGECTFSEMLVFLPFSPPLARTRLASPLFALRSHESRRGRT